MNHINPFLYLLKRADFTPKERYFLQGMFRKTDYKDPFFLPDEILLKIANELRKDKPPFTKEDLNFLTENINVEKTIEDLYYPLIKTAAEETEGKKLAERLTVITRELAKIWTKLIDWEREREREREI